MPCLGQVVVANENLFSMWIMNQSWIHAFSCTTSYMNSWSFMYHYYKLLPLFVYLIFVFKCFLCKHQTKANYNKFLVSATYLAINFFWFWFWHTPLALPCPGISWPVLPWRLKRYTAAIWSIIKKAPCLLLFFSHNSCLKHEHISAYKWHSISL